RGVTICSTQSEQEPVAQTDSSTQQQDPQVSPEGAEVVLHEEELVIDRQVVPGGGVVMRTDVEEEQVTESVELQREEVDVARLSPEEARQQMGAGQIDNEISEESIYIPTTREEAVVDKDVVTTGAVAADTTVVSEQETVGANLRREELEMERLRPQETQQVEQGQQLG